MDDVRRIFRSHPTRYRFRSRSPPDPRFLYRHHRRLYLPRSLPRSRPLASPPYRPLSHPRYHYHRSHTRSTAASPLEREKRPTIRNVTFAFAPLRSVTLVSIRAAPFALSSLHLERAANFLSRSVIRLVCSQRGAVSLHVGLYSRSGTRISSRSRSAMRPRTTRCYVFYRHRTFSIRAYLSFFLQIVLPSTRRYYYYY